MTTAVPTSSEIAIEVLPGYRIAAREKAGKLRMMVFGPLLMFLLQAALQFAIKKILEHLLKQDDPVASIRRMAGEWEHDQLPEVRTAMARVAAGDTGG